MMLLDVSGSMNNMSDGVRCIHMSISVQRDIYALPFYNIDGTMMIFFTSTSPSSATGYPRYLNVVAMVKSSRRRYLFQFLSVLNSLPLVYHCCIANDHN